jgi:hypothetical protein
LPRTRLRILLGENDGDANEHAQKKTGYETKPSGVTHRAFVQGKNSRWFVLVHETNLSDPRAQFKAERCRHQIPSFHPQSTDDIRRRFPRDVATPVHKKTLSRRLDRFNGDRFCSNADGLGRGFE